MSPSWVWTILRPQFGRIIFMMLMTKSGSSGGKKHEFPLENGHSPVPKLCLVHGRKRVIVVFKKLKIGYISYTLYCLKNLIFSKVIDKFMTCFQSLLQEKHFHIFKFLSSLCISVIQCIPINTTYLEFGLIPSNVSVWSCFSHSMNPLGLGSVFAFCFVSLREELSWEGSFYIPLPVLEFTL